MKVCLLMGSPDPNRRTGELCKPFIDELRHNNVEVDYITLHDKTIAPCLGCYHCQNISGEYGCIQKDDMQTIVESILKADILVFATPIYTWQVTPPMKAVMDRMFGLNKFYGSAPREVLNKGQIYALISTCGYDIDYGAGLLDDILVRWCSHSGLPYYGMYAVQDEDNLSSFRTKSAIDGAREFAQELIEYKYEKIKYIKIETTRLILRSLKESDAEAVSNNIKQPIAQHLIYDMVLETEEAALNWINWINNEKFNIAIPNVVLAIELKSSHECIGLIGVAPKQEIDNDIEIFFQIADEYQNNGYATEATKAMIWWAFEKADQDVLSAIVKPENKASRRVIEKLGFIYVETMNLPYDGTDCAFDYFRLNHTRR
ncbi:MAG: GNAT family N-acetyltransferase [Oscillospiraceae bacterium]|nr:GNAT family N-acetyltransferase [Oscillospiraceae bacterium]